MALDSTLLDIYSYKGSENLNISLYLVTLILLFISYLKDKGRTGKALRKSWKSFENILPDFLVIILFVGLLMAFLNHDVISKIIGTESGILGVFLASIVGSVTLIPGFVAFPTAAILLDGGAGYAQIAAFVSTLMMVGVVTIPVEIKYFGKKLTLYRNLFAYGFSLVVAAIIGMVI